MHVFIYRLNHPIHVEYFEVKYAHYHYENENFSSEATKKTRNRIAHAFRQRASKAYTKSST